MDVKRFATTVALSCFIAAPYPALPVPRARDVAARPTLAVTAAAAVARVVPTAEHKAGPRKASRHSKQTAGDRASALHGGTDRNRLAPSCCPRVPAGSESTRFARG